MDKIPKAIYNKTVRQFQKLPAMKSLLNECEKKYAEEFKQRMENIDIYVPYKSPANINFDVRVDSYCHDGPQVGPTIAFRTNHEIKMLKLAGEIADLEQILDSSIDMAVREATHLQKREVYRRALEAHLYHKVSINDLEINKATLRKYRDKAVHNAAEMLGYI